MPQKLTLAADNPPAGVFRRLAAILYDAFLLFALLAIATVPAVILNDGKPVSHYWAYKLYLFLIWFLFYAGFWRYGGETLGMRTWKIRLISFNGDRISWKQAFIRFFTSAFGTANLWALIDKNGLGWHDYLSHTAVVQVKT